MNEDVFPIEQWGFSSDRHVSELGGVSYILTNTVFVPQHLGGLQDLHELDPRTFLIVEAKRDRPGVLGEILELLGREKKNDLWFVLKTWKISKETYGNLQKWEATPRNFFMGPSKIICLKRKIIWTKPF